MKCYIVLLIVFALFVPTMFATDQGGDELTQTYTSEDGSLTFNYPEGWFVNIDEEQDEISVSNVEGYSADIATEIPSGQVAVQFLVGTQEEISTTSGIAVPANASAEFLAGYWTGFYSLANFIASAFSEAEPPALSIGLVENVEIGDEAAPVVSMEIEDTVSLLIITFASDDEIIRTVIVSSAYGEMDDYRDTAFAITSSIEFVP